MSRSLFALVATVAVALLPLPVSAQPAASTIRGVVLDSSGGAIPGATVRIVNEETGAATDAVTTEQGAYQSALLVPGKYRVEAALDGFETNVSQTAVEPGQTVVLNVSLIPARLAEAVVVTARRVEEVAQEVPIPVSVVDGTLAESVGAFNVNRLKELIPTVQFYSTNPRNSSIQIRGLGAPFGLTNDGIEPGVGLYIDGVFYAVRPQRHSTSSTSSGSRSCADHRERSSARTRRLAQSTSPPASQASRPPPTSSSTTAISDSFRPRPRSRGPSAVRSSRAGCPFPVPNVTACSPTPPRRTT
jgi:hypothetical protein